MNWIVETHAEDSDSVRPRAHRRRGACRLSSVRAILDSVQAQLAIAGLLEPLRADPARAAALLDIDGTLAPIVRHPSDANVPEPTRQPPDRAGEALRRRRVRQRPLGGGRAADRLDRLDRLHRQPRLRAAAARRDRGDRRPARRALGRRGSPRSPTRVDTRELQQLRVRREDKGPIVAFHWRGAPDEDGGARGGRGDRAGGARAGLRGAPRPQGARDPPARADRQGPRRALAARGRSARPRRSTSATTSPTSTPSPACATCSATARCASACARTRRPAELEEAADAMVDGPPGRARPARGAAAVTEQQLTRRPSGAGASSATRRARVARDRAAPLSRGRDAVRRLRQDDRAARAPPRRRRSPRSRCSARAAPTTRAPRRSASAGGRSRA